MNLIRVRLHITHDQWLPFYNGQILEVVAQSVDGRTVRFPAHVLRQFVTEDGISGLFAIFFDANRRFAGIRRVPTGPRGRTA